MLARRNSTNSPLALSLPAFGDDLFVHVDNFFSGIRKGSELNADIKDASISTMLCHLGNMAQDAGETLTIDPTNGKVIGNEGAMRSWKREYQKGWEPKI